MGLMWNKCRGDRREGGEIREREKEEGIAGGGEKRRGEGREKWREASACMCFRAERAHDSNYGA